MSGKIVKSDRCESLWIKKPVLKSLKAVLAMLCSIAGSMPVVNRPTILAHISGKEIKSSFHDIKVSIGIFGNLSGTKRPPSSAYADSKTFKKKIAQII